MDEGLRAGLFLSGLRRIGKTTFLTNDLIPALEEAGALVIYVDLWSNTQASPASQVLAAVKKTLTELTTTGSNILTGLKRNTGADIGIAGFKFGFKLDTLGQEGGPSLAQALMEVVDQAKTNVALIVDAVQLAITSEASKKMLLALKTARDAINSRPHTPGRFIFVGTGSHYAMVTEIAARKNPAFVGATSISYPVLGRDYVVHLLNRLAQEGAMAQPSIDVAERAFATRGSRPEELQRALRLLN
ncbi:MAG: ATP-binding protein, partial [Burkholderiaceae bacterium]|nr:ATP-binding protein [Burkholderiaceae bacterium]